MGDNINCCWISNIGSRLPADLAAGSFPIHWTQLTGHFLYEDVAHYDVILLDGSASYSVMFLATRPYWHDRPVAVFCISEEARKQWLNFGADEVLHPGMDGQEMIQRLTRIAKLYGRVRGEMLCKPLRIDLIGRLVWRDGRQVPVNNREFELLVYLARADGHAVSTEELLRNVWGLGFDPGTNSVAVHIHRLRQKLDVPFAAEPLIYTEKGMGYRLLVESEPLQFAPGNADEDMLIDDAAPDEHIELYGNGDRDAC